MEAHRLVLLKTEAVDRLGARLARHEAQPVDPAHRAVAPAFVVDAAKLSPTVLELMLGGGNDERR